MVGLIDAPIIEVSGRTYPVDVRYQPIDGPEVEEPVAQQDAICDAVRSLQREGPGDMLVFLSGERDIRETADALNDLSLPNTEIFPLYARLSSAEQHRVFKPHTGRRVVLATNVAETSVTVPGIRYVIDPGEARISRYNRRTKVQRLPIEAVSQASADQRAGRCGRIGPARSYHQGRCGSGSCRWWRRRRRRRGAKSGGCGRWKCCSVGWHVGRHGAAHV